VPIVASSSELATQGEERWMHYSDCGCWAARGWAEQEKRTGRAPSNGGASDARTKRKEDKSGSARLGVGAAGISGAKVRLLRLGLARRRARGYPWSVE
jgi:hypothetical protein